jgi:two-component system sensor histidine kinase KdpD
VLKPRLPYLRELALLGRAAAARGAPPVVGPNARLAGAVSERVVVGVNDHPGAERVIRAAQRLADSLHAPWTAVTVETPRTERLGAAARTRIAVALDLAAALGGTIATVPAASVEQGLLAQTTQTRATTLVLGKAPRGWWFELRHGSVVDRLVRALPGMAVYVLPLAEIDRSEALQPLPAPWLGYVAAVAMVGATTLFNLALKPLVGPSPLDMIYLVPVIAAATLLGLRPAVLTAAVAALAYNFFFLAPIYSLSIQDPQNLVDFLVLGGVGVVAAQLAGRVRREANVGARTAADNAAIAGFVQRLGAIADAAGIAQAACAEVTTLLGVATALLVRRDQAPHALAAVPADPSFSTTDLAAAQWALQRGERSGRGTATLDAAEWAFHPLRAASGVLAVLGIHQAGSGAPLPPDRQVLLATLLRQAALAFERVQLAAEARRAQALQQRDDLRATLISALGHDLRTPLTIVVAAADTLAREHGGSPAADSLRESAWRLHRLFNDLVEMTRIESGSLAVRREALDLTDVVAAALRDSRLALAEHRLVVALAPNLPLLIADQNLLHHVLINLIDNAAKYSPAGTTITLESRRSGSDYALAIVDEGPGLPPGEEAQLFERFHRVEGSDQKGGSGLGLAIVKGFAEAMGLSVSASNRPDQQGSSFVLTWPEVLVFQGIPVDGQV